MRSTLKRTVAITLSAGLMVAFIGGCSVKSTKETKNNSLGVAVNEATVEKTQNNMESVFLDSKYVSGDSIDAFIDNKDAKEITIVNKSSKDDTDINKISVERYGDEYVCNGKTYKYFYKMTHSEGNETSRDYILGNVILDEKEYNNYMASSTQGENAPLIVASNIEK